MPESENKRENVIYWRDAMPSGGSQPEKIKLCDYLTPREAEKAGEEGWSRVIAQIAGVKN